MKPIRIYFEGDDCLRSGFHEFFKEIVWMARERRCRFDLIATGGTPVADFKTAVKSHPNSLNIILLDSEEPWTDGLPEKRGLGAGEASQVFWMKELMEAWFLADPEKLGQYFGHCFSKSALPRRTDVEGIPKQSVIEGLRDASRNCKVAYSSGTKCKHGPKILSSIRPEVVARRAKECERLFSFLRAHLAAGNVR